MSKIKILIVEDRDIIRDSMKLFFNNSNEIQIIGEADNGFDAITLLEDNKYDLILMDINMPEMNGIVTTQKIIEKYPNSKILVNSFHDNLSYVLGSIKAGAKGYVTKSDNFEVYLTAIKEICKGKFYISDKVSQLLPDDFMNINKSQIKKI